MRFWASVLRQLHSGYIISPRTSWAGNPWERQFCPVGLLNIIERLRTRVLEHTPRYKCLLKYKWNTLGIIKKHGRSGAPLILVTLSMYQIVNVNWPCPIGRVHTRKRTNRLMWKRDEQIFRRLRRLTRFVCLSVCEDDLSGQTNKSTKVWPKFTLKWT